ncbi:cytochrome c family protein [bacterium]|nr:cytochrome c family protein [bacterium]
MKKFVTLFIVSVAALALVSIVIAASDTPPDKPVKITIDGQATKPPVTFDHPKHLEYAKKDCQACHHADAKGTGTKCSECHTKDGKENAWQGKKAMPAKKAFHDGCVKCHKEQGKGPVFPKPADCTKCHNS